MALKRVPLAVLSKAITAHYGRDVMTRGEVNDFCSMKGWSRSDGWNSDPIKSSPTAKNASGYRFSGVSAAKTNKVKIDVNKLDETEETSEIFEDLESLTQVVARGNCNALVCVGTSGVGKSFTVLEQVEKLGLRKGKDYIVIKSKCSPLGLYLQLFLHHDKLIIFDDCDSLWQNEDCAAILKAVLDSYEVREVTWSSKKMTNVIGLDSAKREQIETEARERLLDGETNVDLPNAFVFSGKIIFISNLQMDRLDNAVKSRSVTIDLSLSDVQIFSRMKSVVTKLKNKRTAEMAFAIIVKKYNDGVLELPNLRTVLNYANVVESGVKNAERLSKYC